MLESFIFTEIIKQEYEEKIRDLHRHMPYTHKPKKGRMHKPQGILAQLGLRMPLRNRKQK